jgi:hypothetical protein
MATITSIQNQSYIIVLGGVVALPPDFNSPVALTCLDNQGNTIQKTIVETNSFAGIIDIYLPIISSLGNDLNVEISIVILNQQKKMSIRVGQDGINPPVDVIGQQQNLLIPALTYTAGAVLTFRPAYEGYWSYSVTEN